MNDFFEKNIQPKVDNLLAQLKLEPNNVQLLLEIGEIYHDFHNFDLSKKFFRQVVKIDPSSYEAYYYLGCAGKFYFPYLHKAIKLSKELVGCISSASYTFVNLGILVHDTTFMHPTLLHLLIRKISVVQPCSAEM
jgi:tetratricopeptide (TPR) repeat protein